VELWRASIGELLTSGRRALGFWGAPPREALEEAAARHPGAPWLDLDVFHGAPRSRAVPDAFCHIIRNCVDNALAAAPALDCVVAATGPEKCDAGRFAARLVGELTGTRVVETVNEGAPEPAPAPLCDATGPLKRRVVRVMEAIVEPLTAAEAAAARRARAEPTHGFWGTPPHPIELLDLFPDTTAVFGWTRCVEQGRPADLDLELYVPEGLPVVFFSQGFCAKGMLARRLAERHRGMHVDVHDALGAATRAKIEAFIRLTGAEARR
jgi:hypothetical protein